MATTPYGKDIREYRLKLFLHRSDAAERGWKTRRKNQRKAAKIRASKRRK